MGTPHLHDGITRELILPVNGNINCERSIGRMPVRILFLLALLLLGLLLFLTWGFRGGRQRITKMDVQLVGDDFRFGFRYPGEDLVLGNEDDRFGSRDLLVPAGAKIRLVLESRDYVYLFEIPEVKVYEVAAPDLEFHVTFHSPAPGKYPLLGSQMCGYEHAELLGSLIVQPSDEFWQTSLDLSRTPTPVGIAK